MGTFLQGNRLRGLLNRYSHLSTKTVVLSLLGPAILLLSVVASLLGNSVWSGLLLTFGIFLTVLIIGSYAVIWVLITVDSS